MRFLMIVLAVHFVAEMINGKRKDKSNDRDKKDEKAVHPAEFNMR